MSPALFAESSSSGSSPGAELQKVEDYVFDGEDRFGDPKQSLTDPGSLQKTRSGKFNLIGAVKNTFLSVGKTIKGLESKFNNFNNDIVKRTKSGLKGLQKKVDGILHNIDEFLFPSSYADEIFPLSEEARDMVSWMRNSQNSKTGLVSSYEGESTEHTGSGYTYDQSLAVMAFMVSGEVKRARRILDFYMDQIREKKLNHNGFINGYDATEGYGIEYKVHSGPNAWIGMAALQYVRQTGQKQYLKIAEQAGDFLIEMMDPEGGVKGGPEEKWYSTEHNLDAYAFFKQMYEYTGNEKYNLHNKVKGWLMENSFVNFDNCLITRGKRDVSPATDVYSWAIAALGPRELYLMLVDPDEVIAFAIKRFEVQTEFKNPDGSTYKVTGFDFTIPSNMGRKGIVSGEWTAQMIGTLKIMAGHYEGKDFKKFQYYDEKARFYETELSKMKIGDALPYASKANEQTGHGWRTPRGENLQALSSTAYYVLSSAGYNPFTGEPLTHPVQ